MSREVRPTLKPPLRELLDSRLDPVREATLWAGVQTRRERSHQQASGPELRTPIAQSLVGDADLVAERSRLWREIVARRHAPRRRLRGSTLAVGSLAVAAAVALGFVGLGGLSGSPFTPAPAALTQAGGEPVTAREATSRAELIKLADDSEILLEPGTRIEPLASSGTRFELLLARGRAEFSVTPDGPRRWVIEAGLARVEVVGTVFRVERSDRQVQVSVARGVVLVRGDSVPGLVQRVTAGQSIRVRPGLTQAQPGGGAAASEPSAAATAAALTPEVEPLAVEALEAAAQPTLLPAAGGASGVTVEALPAVSTATAEGADEPAEALAEDEAEPRPNTRGTRRGRRTSWQADLAAGRYEAAYAALGPRGFQRELSLARSADVLLALADVARLSGHPAEATLSLERVLDQFGESPHAALAAFTLGRVLLDQLGAPAKAAAAFERAIGMHPPHALLSNCHIRLVEAYARSGESERAARAAERYRALFPQGRHLGELERWTH